MTDAHAGVARVVVVARIDPGDDTSLCALYDDGEVIRAAISVRQETRALAHAQAHAARGITIIQVCSITCEGV